MLFIMFTKTYLTNVAITGFQVVSGIAGGMLVSCLFQIFV